MAKKIVECEPIEAYQIKRWVYVIVSVIGRGLFLCVAVSISYFILYKQCLHNPECNLIATTFFAILALAFLDAAGFPTSKFIPNLKFS